jgi:hypothetical protein
VTLVVSNSIVLTQLRTELQLLEKRQERALDGRGIAFSEEFGK